MQTPFVDTREFLSQTKFYEGYSRFKETGNGGYESWDESVDRVITMHEENYNEAADKLSPYLQEARTAYKEQRVLGAQRALQFGGEQLLKHQMRMYNCTSSYADRAEFFGEFFYILLCGAGAGFSVQQHHVAKFPEIQARTKQAKGYIVEDSIEGWASALDVLMSSYFVSGGKFPEYEGRRVFFDLTNIRPKGAKISGGFKAPGPEGLRKALDKIELLLQNQVIDLKEPIKLKPITVYDICMHAADAVLSGGVRRSATICLFSPEDDEMMNAKTGNWFMDNAQRGRSNNSAVIVRDEATPEMFAKIMESVKSFGEPGFYFTTSKEHTTNPCVEIGMYPQYEGESGWQGCNLTEINGGLCKTPEDFYTACRAGAILGTLQAGYTDFKFLSPVSKKIFDREALLGVSVTGWMNNPDVLFELGVDLAFCPCERQVDDAPPYQHGVEGSLCWILRYGYRQSRIVGVHLAETKRPFFLQGVLAKHWPVLMEKGATLASRRGLAFPPKPRTAHTTNVLSVGSPPPILGSGPCAM